MIGHYLGVIAALAVVSLPANPAAAQDGPASIIVLGQGHVEAQPDTFSMSADVQGKGATQGEAILQMTAAQTVVTDKVTGLRGLTSARFTTGLPTVLPVYETNCAGRAPYGQPTPCPVTGYIAAMTLSLEGQPAERGGDAVSIAAESGARSARLMGLSLADDQIFRRRAAQAAMADAREQADIIAQAAGQRVVRILQVQTPGSADRLDLDDGFYGGQMEANYVVATPITLVPGPVSIQSRLSVTFAIE